MAGDRERVFPAAPLPVAGNRVIVSPFQFATSEDDNLRIESVNSLAGVVLTVQGRRLTTRGEIEPFAFTHTPNSDRSVKTQDFKLGAGALMNLTLFCSSGTPARGQTFVSARFIRGLSGATLVLGTLLQGYVTASQHLGYPGSPITGSFEGDGYTRAIAGTDPPAGVGIGETVPSGARWRLDALQANLVTSAAVVTRQPYLYLTYPGLGSGATLANPGSVPASQNADFCWARGVPLATDMGGLNKTGGLPDVLLTAASTIQVTATNFQAGDNWSAPVMNVTEWLEF